MVKSVLALLKIDVRSLISAANITDNIIPFRPACKVCQVKIRTRSGHSSVLPAFADNNISLQTCTEMRNEVSQGVTNAGTTKSNCKQLKNPKFISSVTIVTCAHTSIL